MPKGCLWICKHKHIQKATFFNYFLRSKVLTNPTLIQLRGVWWTPSLIFLEVGHGKTKPNRWVGRPPEIRNLHRCHSLQKFSKHQKTTKTYRLESNRLPFSSQRVKKQVYNVKIKDIEDKIPNITNLATDTILNAKINEVNKTPGITNVARTVALNAKLRLKAIYLISAT